MAACMQQVPAAVANWRWALAGTAVQVQHMSGGGGFDLGCRAGALLQAIAATHPYPGAAKQPAACTGSMPHHTLREKEVGWGECTLTSPALGDSGLGQTPASCTCSGAHPLQHQTQREKHSWQLAGEPLRPDVCNPPTCQVQGAKQPCTVTYNAVVA